MMVLADIWTMIRDSREWKAMSEALRKIPELETRIAALERRISGSSAEHICDHCGSNKTTRSGTRFDPAFGQLGSKQAIFICESCGKQSFFIPKTSEA